MNMEVQKNTTYFKETNLYCVGSGTGSEHPLLLINPATFKVAHNYIVVYSLKYKK